MHCTEKSNSFSRSRSPHRMELGGGRRDDSAEKPIGMLTREIVKDEHGGVLAKVVNESYSEYELRLLSYIESRYKQSPKKLRFPFIRDVSNYENKMKIGHGTFGEVFKAKCKETNRVVATKKILLDNNCEGFPITAIREVAILQKLRCEYLTELIEICHKKGFNGQDMSTFYLVFAFCDYDLAGLLTCQNVKFALEDIKCMMKHMLSGLLVMHKANFLHRDMKTANILISPDGILKVTDFGLSRRTKSLGSSLNYTNKVVTLWYRSPELLLGSRSYDFAIDLWSVGCIMAELWTRAALMPGTTEQQQLELIQKLCGGIGTSVWRGVEKLPYFSRIVLTPDRPRVLREKMLPFVEDLGALELFENLLTLDPSKRIDASTALKSNFFFSSPLPRQNIKHVLVNLPKNIFEFTARNGVKPDTQSKSNRSRPGDAFSSQKASNGVGNAARRPLIKNMKDGQLQDILY